MRISEFTPFCRLREPDHFLDFWAFANVWFIIFLLYLLSSRFVFSPGITVDLPHVTDPLATAPTTGVLTLSNDRLFFFDGKIISLENLQEILENFLVHHTQRPAILLVRPDKNLSIDVLCQVGVMAKRAGFEQIQIACLESEREK